MSGAKHTFSSREKAHGSFLAPSFEIEVGSVKIDSAKVPVTSLSVDIDAGEPAGGCYFVIESLYDYKTSSWKENVLTNFKIGSKLEIKGGYLKRETIFYGYVDDVTIDYSAEGAPRLAVGGIDAKGYLMNKKDEKSIEGKTTKDVVEKILKLCTSSNPKAAKKISLAASFPLKNGPIKSGVNYYNFLNKVAKMNNMQFFVCNGEIIFDNVVKKSDVLIKLSMGTSLLRFSRTASLHNQIGAVKITGTGDNNLAVTETATTPGSTSAKGSTAKKISPLIAGITLEETNQYVKDAQECKAIAQAILDASAINFVKGKGRCLGLPELIPGKWITLDGMDKTSNNNYFVTKVSHEFSSESGYFTSFEAKSDKLPEV